MKGSGSTTSVATSARAIFWGAGSVGSGFAILGFGAGSGTAGSGSGAGGATARAEADSVSARGAGGSTDRGCNGKYERPDKTVFTCLYVGQAG